MRRVLTRWLPLAAFTTLGLGGALLFVPLETELLVRIYLLALAALALLTATAATTYALARAPSAFAAALRSAGVRNERPEELVRLERQLALASDTAADFHFRLRPSLVLAADAAVWRRHGVSLDDAEALLPPRLWAVVRPDLPPPADRRAPGPSLRELAGLLDEIERMGT